MPTTTATAIDIVTRAFKAAGILASGEALDAENAADGFDILNGMLDGWTMDRLYVFATSIAAYALTSGTQNYTIGQSAGAAFNAVRPSRIENANLVFTSQNPNTRIQLQLLDDDGWMNIPVRNVSGTPTKLYYSPDYPNGTLSLWPIPTAGFSLELEAWTPLPQFALQATPFSFPPGYFEAMYTNLARRLCVPQWGITVVPNSLEKLADDARARIQSLNMNPPPQMTTDYGIQGTGQAQGYRNIYNPAPIWYR